MYILIALDMKWLLKWTENIRLTYFDHYHMRLKESLTSGKTVDYSDYINTCMEFKEKAMNLLKEAYKDNVNMFRQVNDEFPLDEADKLIEKLTQ